MIAREGRNARSRRRGSLLAETAMSGVMLIIAMGLVAQVVAAVANQRRSWDRRQTAVFEAANLMERLTARPFEALTTEGAKDLTLSDEAKRTLPEGRVQVEITDGDPVGGDGSKRVFMQIQWRNRAGDWDAPVRLTTWVHRRKGGGS